MRSVPSSLPPCEIDIATYLPSRDGTNQSIAVLPVGSSLFGSSTTLSDFKSSADDRVTSICCCSGGWNLKANKTPGRETIPEYLGEVLSYQSVSCFSIAARSGNLSRYFRVR